MKQNGEINRLGKGRGSKSVREAGKVKIFQTVCVFVCVLAKLGQVCVCVCVCVRACARLPS